MRWHIAILALLLAALSPLAGGAADWITAPSYYTHDWTTGHRVAQYSPIGPYYYYARPDFLRSGYRHYRSTIDLGNSSDNLHIVEEWGRPVRPYEEWRFPYRPYSVPYDLWGPPFGGLGNAGAFFPFGAFPGPYPYSAPGPYPYSGSGAGDGHGHHVPHFPPAVNYAQPWLDGHYPQYDTRDRSQYWRPYTAPRSHSPHTPAPPAP
jgi:hypothetical protein